MSAPSALPSAPHPPSAICASTLLLLEISGAKRKPQPLEIGVKSLDDELGDVFEWGSVVGVRGPGEGIDELLLPLLTTHLLSSLPQPQPQPALDPQTPPLTTSNPPPQPTPTPTTFIITHPPFFSPHALHSNLLTRLPPPATHQALPLLSSISLLRVLSLYGLVDALSEIETSIAPPAPPDNPSHGTIILLHNIAALLSSHTHTAGAVQTNALLSPFLRRLGTLARQDRGVVVLVSLPSQRSSLSAGGRKARLKERQGQERENGVENARAAKSAAGWGGGGAGETETSISSFEGNVFGSTNCGLGRSVGSTLDAVLDTVVLVGAVEMGDASTERVVEVVRQRNGSKAGKWAAW